MRTSPSRTVLASLISMTVLSACSGGNAPEAGVPVAAGVVQDASREALPAPAPVAAVVPAAAPVASPADATAHAAPVPAPVPAADLIAAPAPIQAAAAVETPLAAVTKTIPLPVQIALATLPVAMPAPAPALAEKSIIVPPVMPPVAKPVVAPAVTPAPPPAKAAPLPPVAAPATPAPPVAAPAKPAPPVAAPVTPTPPVAAPATPAPPVATPAKPTTPVIAPPKATPPVAAPVKPIEVPPVVAPAKPVPPVAGSPKPPAVVAPPKVIAKPPVVATPPVATNLAPLPPSLPLDAASGAITDIHVTSTAAAAQQSVPLTFGQVFEAGDVGPAQQLVGKLGDGSSVPLQVDVKARHPDGSVRHAVISASLPKLGVAQVQRMILAKSTTSATGSAPSAAALLAAGFSAGVQVDLAGVRYSASADSLLRNAKPTAWLSGPISTEWLVSAPLTKADGTAHPHLSARFAIRTFAGTKQARVDVTIENNWAYADAPRNFTYNANILVGGQSVYKKDALTHLHHARWRKVFWWGQEPAAHIMHNVGYLLSTRALPNYDREVRVSNARLDELNTRFRSGGRDEPMSAGLAMTYMPGTGGRDDIGLLPGWAATYLLTMDKRAKEVTLGTADLAGSWSIHYRDKKTDKPISLHDYPYMTVLGHKGDTLNPATKAYESFPACPKEVCATPLGHDVSHQPNFAYLPYMLTGDHYYLEELQFWGTYDAFSSNPGYRQGISGLVKPEQVRGQAWALRTIAEAAYITPDGEPLKTAFDSIVKANLKWYNDNYTNSPTANKLGVLSHGYAIVYNGGIGLAPWMDDFFTSAVGHTAELGFKDALPLLKWKAKFPIERMVSPDACWVTGAMYSMQVRDTADGALYTSIGKAWKSSSAPTLVATTCASQAMATALNLKVGEMTGYSSAATGFPSNMQPALAYAADVGGTQGKAAWQRFMARTVKPNYGNGPQFAVVPR